MDLEQKLLNKWRKLTPHKQQQVLEYVEFLSNQPIPPEITIPRNFPILPSPTTSNAEIPRFDRGNLPRSRPDLLSQTSNSQDSKDGCFIVTACDADAETLNTFYKLRNEILLCSIVGKKLVQLYYRYSPSLASIIRSSQLLKKMILMILLKPLAALLRRVM